MADEESKRSTYPSIPTSIWLGLRNRFKNSPPSKVDAEYLQSALEVGQGHARNLIPQLKNIGLLKDTGELTDLAHDWRQDETYAEASSQMRETLYPASLREALPPPSPNRAAVEGWFSRNAKVGEGAARKMASFYLLLCDPTTAGQKAERKPRERKPAGKVRTLPTSTRAVGKRAADQGIGTDTATIEKTHDGPSFHVDVQVHIPPDASAEQIDQIFAAMAKHFYNR